MAKDWKFIDDYKINKNYIYENKIINIYNNDNVFYKSYGNIMPSNISLGLKDYEIEALINATNMLNLNQTRLLSQLLFDCKNLGIKLDVDRIIFLVNVILNNDFGSNISLSSEKFKKERIEKERLEKERLEKERLEKEVYAKSVIDRFLKDITSKGANSNFRGWVLPNGLLMSQYNENSDVYIGDFPRRQDHSSLVLTFIAGLEEYDKDAYDRIMELYRIYTNIYGVRNSSIYESFAVERLGWMQVAVCGAKKIAYRAERWQDRILRTFFVDYGFNYEVFDKGRSYEMEFAYLYDHMDDILRLGLRKRYEKSLKL